MCVYYEFKAPITKLIPCLPAENVAEAVRFELTVGFPTPVFKTGTLNRSVTLPKHKLENHPADCVTKFKRCIK